MMRHTSQAQSWGYCQAEQSKCQGSEEGQSSERPEARKKARAGAEGVRQEGVGGQGLVGHGVKLL